VSLFIEKYPGFFCLTLPSCGLPVNKGAQTMEWEIGRKFTGMSRTGKPMSDGSPSPMTFAGFPWQPVSPKSDGRVLIPFELLPWRYFRRPTDLVFCGTMPLGKTSIYKSLVPLVASVPVIDLWPSETNQLSLPSDSSHFRLESSDQFDYLARRGRIASAFGLHVGTKDMDDDDYAFIGHRSFSNLGVQPVFPNPVNNANCLTGFSPDNLPGITVLELLKVYSNGFEPQKMVIRDPLLAATVHPLFGRFPMGATLVLRPPAYGYRIAANDLTDEFLCDLSFLGEVMFDLSGEPIVALKPDRIPASIPCKPIRVQYGDLYVSSDPNAMIPRRAVSRKYPQLPKYRFHVFGEPHCREGYFYLTSDVEAAKSVDLDAVRTLRAKYKWFVADRHMKYSAEELDAHDRFLTNKDTGYIFPFDGAKDELEVEITSILQRYFSDDSRVVCFDSFAKDSFVYKFPSPEILADHPQAQYELLNALRSSKPGLFHFLSQVDFASVLLPGDLAS